MNEQSKKYGIILARLSVDEEEIFGSYKLINDNSVLYDSLISPAVTLEEKNKIIKSLFPESLQGFYSDLAEADQIKNLKDIYDAYDQEIKKINHVMDAVITYAVRPEEAELEKIREFVKSEFEAEDISLTEKEDKNLIGGYMLQVGDKIYINNIKKNFDNMRDKMKQTLAKKNLTSAEEIISVLKENIENFETRTEIEESGTIIFVGDGIVNIFGLNNAMYGEIIRFENGLRGMVQDIKKDSVGCILFGKEGNIKEGTRAYRTGERASVPVGEDLIGRVVDALGVPIDGKGDIRTETFRLIENEAPGIIERESVNVPMATGILAIDAMFPIGRGQRELIIGDRQTGKTSIAVDAILNQKGQDMICIYVAIGQKASTVSKVATILEKHGAMEYSFIVSATADAPAPLQYIAPYSGTAMAEYFMDKGMDVLVIYDDLSKHAVAYRALSLLLERSPGREAYPGDVFYLHSRLLERSCRLDKEHGGGSITSLPIIETMAGDVSAYIPTNVISITDGQIFLESSLFHSGVRPAVNVGLSVSRVGGAAQTKAMKKASGTLRIDLAQFREMEIFTQFSSDLDESTKKQLHHGHVLMEMLKQPLYRPLKLHEQVISLCVANKGLLEDIELKEIKDFMQKLLEHFRLHQSEITEKIDTQNILDDQMLDKIIEVTVEFKNR